MNLKKGTGTGSRGDLGRLYMKTVPEMGEFRCPIVARYVVALL
jgi:hypothetical protein